MSTVSAPSTPSTSSLGPGLPAGGAAAAHAALRHRMLRTLYGVIAGSALVGALVWAGIGLGPALPLDTRLPVMLAFVALALIAAAAGSLPAAVAAAVLPAVGVASVAVLGCVAAFTGLGVGAPGLVLLSLLVCLAFASGVRGAGAWTGLAAALMVAALGAADVLHLLPQAPETRNAPLPMRLLLLACAVVAGGVGGLALARLQQRQLQAAEGRERRFQALLGIAAAAYWETDGALRLRRVSVRDGSGQFVPLPRVAGRLPWALGALRLDADAADALRADMEGREPLRDIAFQWDCDDGTVHHLLASAEPRKDARGRFLGYWGVARDVTAEAQARDALLATERRYQDLFLHLPTALVVHRRGRIIDANPAAAQLLGYPSAARMIGHDLLSEHLDEVERQQARQRLLQVERQPVGQAQAPVPYRLLATDGRALQVRAVQARADGDGQPAVMTILSDETAALEAARGRQRAEAMVGQVLDTSPDVITLSDALSGEFLMVNAAFERLTGWPADEVVGRTPQQLGLWRDVAEHERLQQQLAASGQAANLTLHYCNRQGQATPLLVSATRFARDGRALLVVNARDLNDVARLRLEREAILAHASVGIAFVRGQRFELVNPPFERLYGLAAGALAGQPVDAVWRSAEERDAVEAELAGPIAEGRAAEVERDVRRADGSPFRLRLRAQALDPLHPVELGTIWIAEDITRQRADEAALTHARDEAQAASRAKSSFLANATLEIRTPLHGLLGLARMARQPGLPPQQQRETLDQIADRAEGLAALLGDILDLSRIETGRLEVDASPFELRQLLHALQQGHAALAAGKGLAFSLEVDRRLPLRVVGDALRLRQILSHFLSQQLAITARGSLRLVVLDRPGERVRFEVHGGGDAAHGAFDARVFEPFAQPQVAAAARPAGGTRLGLAISRELAQLMGGQVGAQAGEGGSGCLWLELPLPAADRPAIASEAPAADAQRLADARRLAGARVLVVEDNAVNMLVTTAVLEQWGVQVLPAADGPQALLALAEAEQSGRPVEAVLMDVQMPGMDGLEATRRLRRRWPAAQLPVIALTAAGRAVERQQALDSGMTDFVGKPIESELLRRALLAALAGRAATPPAG